MAVKILGAAEGFRPKAVMPAKPLAAKIKQGPRMAMVKMKRSVRSRSTLR